MIADLERELSDRKSQSAAGSITTVNPPAEIHEDMFTVDRGSDDHSSEVQKQFRLVVLPFISLYIVLALSTSTYFFV